MKEKFPLHQNGSLQRSIPALEGLVTQLSAVRRMASLLGALVRGRMKETWYPTGVIWPSGRIIKGSGMWRGPPLRGSRSWLDCITGLAEASSGASTIPGACSKDSWNVPGDNSWEGTFSPWLLLPYCCEEAVKTFQGLWWESTWSVFKRGLLMEVCDSPSRRIWQAGRWGGLEGSHASFRGWGLS
jgi:hypothetical protein